ncbi:hypothetical protein BD309DRAFT_853529 [Dichomitus squalens]|uniref:Uncharacterized protein n=1 Tax=Dichomitus squalens TaxID=114155 RepID=A0A4Q9P8Z5_9APHY|nr:uncharacterized protein DICSQDRAFT_132800 [Dichomitus squalens LYAD-421 SS1]EJF65240.1 hypothetical protein DICSQDRAFT_132800 [Dichomitus squalens LYAD-421 SS1]TBU25151.1 hypothetical protein BD311DRAFT_670282 [Dichomitus squalens]TBU48616.1 hypothetical protein BD309DRAFT_853529 [Dichomitus squalens]TBU59674.1 hypothetical protein BD310DRAFT_816871 [Dichomitus squalens]
MVHEATRFGGTLWDKRALEDRCPRGQMQGRDAGPELDARPSLQTRFSLPDGLLDTCRHASERSGTSQFEPTSIQAIANAISAP